MHCKCLHCRVHDHESDCCASHAILRRLDAIDAKLVTIDAGVDLALQKLDTALVGIDAILDEVERANPAERLHLQTVLHAVRK